MKIIYARQPLPKSIFLAGPTPRSSEVKSWRPDALRLIEEGGFEGTVFVPEDVGGCPKFDYDDQVTWEWEGLMTATVVLFWIPREIITMPAFTTNVEYGMSIWGRNMAIGWPENAPKNKYLDRLAARFHLTPAHSLEDTVKDALKLAADPFNHVGI